MRAFLVAARAAVSFYNDLFLLIGLCILWWLTGGIFLGLAAALGITMFVSGTGAPWWLAPLVGIPAGPATAALAVVARRSARDIHVDRSYFMSGLRTHWRSALKLSGLAGVVSALLLLNMVFYNAQTSPYLQLVGVVWAYLVVVWLAVQLYAYPVLVAMERPRILIALRTAAVASFANPLFSALLVVIALLLTAGSVVLAAPLLLAWPALLALLGEHSFRLFLERAGLDTDAGAA